MPTNREIGRLNDSTFNVQFGRQFVREGRRLKFLDSRNNERLEQATHRRELRQGMHTQIEKCAEDVFLTWNRPEFPEARKLHAYMPMVAIVHGGRDCDCVEVSGIVDLVPANWRAVDAFVNRLYEGAEGPIWWHIEKPSAAASVRETHRDRVLEAFEDGHPWSV